jgi:RNA polymerase sigma factor for flagellar operon FliA
MEPTELWEAYQDNGDQTAREALLDRHLRLVHHVARQLMKTSRLDAEFDELVSAGTIGLIKAIENFDPSRGLAFSTFAAPRIRGAILDDFRRRDHAPRSIRRKQRELSHAREHLMATLDRTPSDEELADHLGIEVEKLWRWKRDTERAVHISLDRPVDPSAPRSTTPEQIITDQDSEEIEHSLTFDEEVGILRDEILELKEQERIVLSLYYFEELKLHEIATVLGVTESRISQIRSKALKNLRSRMGHLRETAAG